MLHDDPSEDVRMSRRGFAVPRASKRGAATKMLDHDKRALASASVARHLARGALGFGLIGAAFALTLSTGPAALVVVPLGLIALRGCPTCWIAGLIQTISAGRGQRTGVDEPCARCMARRHPRRGWV
jgi:hypothetical protein